MENSTWGLLGPADLGTERRTRTLEVAAAVRTFNELAVPGLGGVWFAKQAFLATLGIQVAGNVRGKSGRHYPNIEVANAIEAVACLIAIQAGNGRDPRVRGALKMRGRSDFDYGVVRKSNFYVTQPMRMATVQALPTLGFVESDTNRFNSYLCTPIGNEFIELAVQGLRPHRMSVVELLTAWVLREPRDINTLPLQQALSPTQKINEYARAYLRERVVQGSSADAARRRAALLLVESLREPDQKVTWDSKPEILSKDHWRDLQTGALFFDVRNTALVLLDQIESIIGSRTNQRMQLAQMPTFLNEQADAVRQQAQRFLETGYDPSPDHIASKFCQECVAKDEVSIVEALVRRDGNALRMQGCEVVPGGAFRGLQVDRTSDVSSPEDQGAGAEVTQPTPLPENISYRMRNLFMLNLDLHNGLNSWLNRSEDAEGTSV